MTKALLVLDIGSSSIRCIIYHYDTLDVLASYSQKHRSVEPISGKLETDSIVRLVEDAIDKVLLAQQASIEIVALGFSTFVMNLIGLDESNTPVESISYACNTEAVAHEVKALHKDIEHANQLYQLTGAPIHSAYAIAQLRTLYRQETKVKRWTTLASYCLSRWSGANNVPISYSEASWTGLLNFKTCSYEPMALDLLPDSCVVALPFLADFNQVSLKLQADYAQRWPQLKNTQLTLGIGDGAAANIGSKCTNASRIAATIGTSAAARVCVPFSSLSDDFVVPFGLFCYRVNSKYVLIGGALTDGGSVIEWASDLFGLSADQLDETIKEIETDYQNTTKEQKLLFVPFLGGERSTGFRSGATGTMIGLTRETTKKDIIRASLEGVALRLTSILNQIRKVDGVGADAVVVVSGKALEVNSLWRQMIADCSGSTLVFDDSTAEGTIQGVAVLLKSPEDIMVSELQVKTKSTKRVDTANYWKDLQQNHEAFLDKVSSMYIAN